MHVAIAMVAAVAAVVHAQQQQQPSTAVRAVADAQSALGWRVLEAVAAKAGTQNAVVSPLSIFTALCLVAPGLDDAPAVHDAMATALGVSGDDARFGKLVATCGELDGALAANAAASNVTYTLANSLWSRGAPRAEYAAAVASYYERSGRVMSGAFARNLTDGAAINAWIADATNDLITKVLDDGPLYDPVLVNAIYFLAKWKFAFDKDDTVQKPFLAAGAASAKATDTMVLDTATWKPSKAAANSNSAEPELRYYNGGGAQYVELPYGRADDERAAYGRDTNMRAGILLPHTSDAAALDAFIADGGAKFDAVRVKASKRKGELHLPKFKVDEGSKLKATLKALGFGAALFDGAPITNMFDEPFTVDEVIHHAVIDVDEAGTEAAAVTVVALAGSCFRCPAPTPPPRFTMKVNRPFLFTIIDDATDAVLFAAKVNTVGSTGGDVACDDCTKIADSELVHAEPPSRGAALRASAALALLLAAAVATALAAF